MVKYYKGVRSNYMHLKNRDSNQTVLVSLWGRNVPPLTAEEVELSVQVWQKIKARRQREQNNEPGMEVK